VAIMPEVRISRLEEAMEIAQAMLRRLNRQIKQVLREAVARTGLFEAANAMNFIFLERVSVRAPYQGSVP